MWLNDIQLKIFLDRLLFLIYEQRLTILELRFTQIQQIRLKYNILNTFTVAK
jgi:hypothetical protein